MSGARSSRTRPGGTRYAPRWRKRWSSSGSQSLSWRTWPSSASRASSLPYTVADDEVVPFLAVEVDHDRAERERVRHGARDRREERRKLFSGPHKARDFEQASQPRKDRRLTQVESGHRRFPLTESVDSGGRTRPPKGGAMRSQLEDWRVRLLDHERIVGRADDRGARLAGEPREQDRDRDRVRAVEAGGGLVGEQERGPRGERARDRDARPLALREARDALRGALDRARPTSSAASAAGRPRPGHRGAPARARRSRARTGAARARPAGRRRRSCRAAALRGRCGRASSGRRRRP